ncbi:hypothetical protein I601_2085 [Nocardioides dokdonensis FR1436]|uniref:TfoX N-terminal domain-containing protein n=1 Tax=Nocardioides dokdonensis FR1436 TaxID=1300347 RepID=A0A1A9GLN5_9ACTN|nr:TfoX/Sxy family protein [Nocardioides dokdonensis]ANH38513.1 hypothetical protein I601_2085 [Nocardioides dokdonensis FR1436]
MVDYDTDLLDRLRLLLGGEPGLSERAMFGGVALMLDGKMCVGVMKGGGMMVRLSAEEGESAVQEPYARKMDFTGRPMRGWIIVDSEGLSSEQDLGSWVDRAVRHVRTLPPKTGGVAGP